jgi:hypothetical protein
VAGTEPKEDLRRYLQLGRDAIVWKLDGLSEYDARRPLVPTGTNLLGLLKHLAGIETGYLGASFGRPFPDAFGGDEGDPAGDMFASAEESREFIVELYRRSCRHADETIAALPLDAVGRVRWWPAERAEATLHGLLVRVATETHRHAGQADIIRELVDGAVGWTAEQTNLPSSAWAGWPALRDRIEAAARAAAAEPPPAPPGPTPSRSQSSRAESSRAESSRAESSRAENLPADSSPARAQPGEGPPAG